MAIEDAVVLADAVGAAPDIDTAITTFVNQRDQRVEWVRQESLAVGEAIDLAPERRNPSLRRDGQAVFHHRFAPLTAPVDAAFATFALER
jgi:hypothetical protein